MTRIRIAGAVLLVVLGAGLLIRITESRVPPRSPARASVEIPAPEGQPIIETSLRN